MLVHVPHVSFDGPVPPMPALALAARLEAVLVVLPPVDAVHVDPVVEAMMAPLSGRVPTTAVRRVRLGDGRSLSVAAVPSDIWREPASRRSVLALRDAAGHLGRRVIVGPETAVDREPRLGVALLVAGAASAPAARRDVLALETALAEAGGQMALADAVELMTRSDDPVASVLSLVARRVLAVDVDRELGPDTRVSFRRRGCDR